MPAAGDDLRKYLIVPLTYSPSSSNPQSTQGTDSVLNPASRSDPPRFHKSANRKAESSNMEVAYSSQPDTLASVPAGDAAVSSHPQGIMSVDEFLSTHLSDHDAHLAAREAAMAPPTKKSKTQLSTPSQPVAVGARSSKYTILLHEKYQALAIPQPMFTFRGDSVTRWSVEVSFPGLQNAEELQGLKEDGCFNSKQEAKEAVSKSALTILEKLVDEGRVASAGKAKKSRGELAQQQPKEREEARQNFVGQLLEFQRATSTPQPLYTDYQLGARWACLMEIEGHDKPFSSLDALFGSKKAARQHAAGCAVAHFKAQGLWPEDFTTLGGIRKRKPGNPTVYSHSSSGDDVTAGIASSPGGASATSQVAALAHLLNLNTPEYRFTHDSPSVPGIHTVSCFFKNGGAHEGPIGEVRNVCGRKKAKEECARLALQYLTVVKRQREELAAKLIAEIAGGAGVTSVAVDTAMDGEENVAKRIEEATCASDDDSVIYEDAMEH